MKMIRYILMMAVMLVVVSLRAFSQGSPQVVCAGDSAVSYTVSGTAGSSFIWTLEEGGIIAEEYGDSIVVNWGTEVGEYELSVQEVSQYGCYSEPKHLQVQVSAPSIELGEDTYICEGESFRLTPQGDYYSFLWHDGSSTPGFTTTEEGLITCTVSNEYGCLWTDDLYLEVKDLPEVDLGRDTSLCGEQTVYLNAGYEGINFNWSTGENSQEILVYQGQQEIWVEVEDEDGCKNRDTIMILKCDPGLFFKDIPTAITPGTIDGHNDTWEIKKLDAYPDAIVDIYDRWGRLIWRSAPGYPIPWDGRDMHNKLVPMDSYHFIILLNFGQDDRVIGSVTVIR